jgi:hypothetical protein
MASFCASSDGVQWYILGCEYSWADMPAGAGSSHVSQIHAFIIGWEWQLIFDIVPQNLLGQQARRQVKTVSS